VRECAAGGRWTERGGVLWCAVVVWCVTTSTLLCFTKVPPKCYKRIVSVPHVGGGGSICTTPTMVCRRFWLLHRWSTAKACSQLSPATDVCVSGRTAASVMVGVVVG